MSANKTLPERNPEKFERLRALVESGVSLNEINRTLRIDYRTVRKYFPNYKPFQQGGGWGAGAENRELFRKFQDLERYGKVQSNRDAGRTFR